MTKSEKIEILKIADILGMKAYNGSTVPERPQETAYALAQHLRDVAKAPRPAVASDPTPESHLK